MMMMMMMMMMCCYGYTFVVLWCRSVCISVNCLPEPRGQARSSYSFGVSRRGLVESVYSCSEELPGGDRRTEKGIRGSEGQR